MSSRVILEIEAGLSSEEVEKLRQLLYDALGEFVTARGGHLDEPAGTLQYVNKRYPDMTGMAREHKIDEVMLRKRIARKLHLAASDVRVEPVVPVAERECVVLPTVFAQTVEDEAKLLADAMRDAKRDEASPLTAYAKPDPTRDLIGSDFEFDVERFTIPPKK
jgi:hypothetical protein